LTVLVLSRLCLPTTGFFYYTQFTRLRRVRAGGFEPPCYPLREQGLSLSASA